LKQKSFRAWDQKIIFSTKGVDENRENGFRVLGTPP
jgi:hypothetical protein